MQQFQIRHYSSADYGIWNSFVDSAKNATFLFHRDFLEYHSDRFSDHSLLIFKDDVLISLLPANRSGNEVHSHAGLTYGGFILAQNIRLEVFLKLFRDVLEFLKNEQVNSLRIKLLPNMYCDGFSEEIKYALFLSKANLYRCDTLSVIDTTGSFAPSKDRRAGMERGRKNNLTIREEDDFSEFWSEILIPNLKAKHGAAPVHSLEEIQMLKKRFPQNIRQFNVYQQENLVAGTTIFESRYVAHSQYISGNADKNTLGSLDFLHEHLICNVFAEKMYFDFGISNESEGRFLNKGLHYWKESFGSQTVVQEFWKVETTNFNFIDSVLL